MAQVPVVENHYVGDGTTRVFALTWPYLSPLEVFVSVNGVDVPYAFLAGAAATVQTVVAPPNGSAVRVYRNTRAEVPLHKFAGGVPFLPRYIDENADQLLFALQEGVTEFAEVGATANAALAASASAQQAALASAASAAAANAQIDRTLRVSPDEPAILPLVSAVLRANKVLGFDAAGKPIALLPGTGTATELALDLANAIDQAKGAGMIGYKSSTVAARLDAYLDNADPAKGAALLGYKGRNAAAKFADMPSVKDYGAKGDGVTDDRAAIQAALTANAGGSLFIPSGVYMLSSTLFIPSGTKVYGLGAASRLRAMASFIMLNVPWAGGQLPVMLANEGILTSAAATRIEINSVYCDSSLTGNGVHNVHMRNTSFCSVSFCTFGGGADGTAFTLSANYKVTNNFAFGQTNCCYDQWEGSTRGLVADNIGYLSVGYGMLVTGDTSLNTVGQSGQVTLSGNIIIGDGTVNSSIGIWLQSGSNLTSQCYSCRCVNNYVNGFRTGIRLTGGGQHIVSDNRIEDCPEQGLSLSAEVVGNGTKNNSLNGNVLNNSGNAAGGGAIVVQLGSSFNTFTGTITSAITAAYAVVLDSTTADNNFMGGNLFSRGTAGYVSDAGQRNLCADVPSGFYLEDVFTPGLTSSGGGGPAYSAQYGNFQIIGKYCFFTLRVALSNLGSLAAGNVQITGLPRPASAANVNNQPTCPGSFSNCQTTVTSAPSARIPSGTSRLDLYKWGSGSIQGLTVSDITGTFEANISGRYRTA